MPNNKIIDLDRLSRFKEKLDIELEKKANVDGNYPTMTVGAADSLTPYGENSGANDTTPFVFQSAGGSSDVGSKAYLRELRGNTVAFNQLKTHGNFDVDSGWAVENATKSVSNNIMTVTASGTNQVSLYTNNIAMSNAHKYYLRFTLKNSNTGHLRISLLDGSTYSEKIIIQSNIELNTTKQTKEYIFTSNLQGNGKIFVCTYLSTDISGGETTQFENFNLIDLTLMFGAGNEPTSVLEFNRLFPKPYYPYNAGELLSCKSNGIKNVGYNAFDGETENGYINSNGNIGGASSNEYVHSKNFIKVICGQPYTCSIDRLDRGNTYVNEYDENKNNIKQTLVTNGSSIVLTNNTHFVKLCWQQYVIDVSTACFHLTWDGSRTGYEPYESNTYALPNIELRSAGSAYDVLYITGGGKRRIGVVDLGTLDYVYSDGLMNSSGIQGLIKPPSATSIKVNAKSSRYITISYDDYISVGGDKVLYVSTSGVLRIRDSAYTDAATFKTAMSGVYLYYELATETDITTEENQGWQNPQDIDDFGTQEFLYDSDIAIPIPQGNDFFYPVDYKAFIDSLGGREDIEYAADKVVSQEQLQTALSTFLSSISGYDATKTQTLKNVSGVFQWVDD